MTTDNTGTGPGAVTPYDSSSGYTAPKTGTDVKPTTPKSSSKTYIVQAHDTIYGIARTQLGNGSRAKDIIALNPGIDKDHIKPGQVLNMPEK
jgi:nucleoid-associated protein YgaU